MTDQITLEEALELVIFRRNDDATWCVEHVRGNVRGNVWGNVWGSVGGNLYGTINGREWQFIETPEQKFRRLLNETRNQELIEAFNQLENN